MVYITIWGWKSTGGDSKIDFGTSRTSSNVVGNTMITPPQFLMVYTTHLWWFWGWLTIFSTTLSKKVFVHGAFSSNWGPSPRLPTSGTPTWSAWWPTSERQWSTPMHCWICWSSAKTRPGEECLGNGGFWMWNLRFCVKRGWVKVP